MKTGKKHIILYVVLLLLVLVVAPSDVKTVAPAIERAYRAGIPVILYDRMFLERFKKAAKLHIGDANLRMDDLGSELSLSKVQMYRKVKALTGKTPAEVLREMRMQKAYSLLKQTDKTISEVAAEVGFAIPGYFSACFKKQFGINPTELRD